MKQRVATIVLALIGVSFVHAQSVTAQDRIAACQENYHALFGGRALTGDGTDPELMDILQKFIFGEVFHTGELSMRQRELITCVCLASIQALPQLESHAGGALNAGATPVELREAIYQCAPFIGFPRVLNAIGSVNKTFAARGIDLPLESQGTVTEANRHAEGEKIQALYGGDGQDLRTLPQGLGDAVADYITEVRFGDFSTRKGLDLQTRELLSLCSLAAIGALPQMPSHVKGCLKAGLPKETLYAAMIQCLPYVGFPNALNGINVIKDAE